MSLIISTATSSIVQQRLFSAAALVGSLAIAKQVFRLSQFLWFYFLKPSSVGKYLHGSAPYAVVTGATEGIGKATAIELFRRGFNLIIHGRNEAKVQKVVEEIKAHGSGDVRYFLADAAKGGNDFARILEPFSELNITLVIHNVGGSYMTRDRIDTLSEEQAAGIVNWNDVFPLLLTRALLPQLRSVAQRGPVLVEFVGSLTRRGATPTLAIYAATKAFLHVLARALDNEERLWGVPSGVRVAYLDVGPVNSAANRLAPSLTTPSSPAFAKALVDKIGCGKRSYAPYYMHALIGAMGDVLPESWVEGWHIRLTKNVYAAADKAV